MFAGVRCWHPEENKFLDLRLSDMGLRGQFPLGIINCSSLTSLDFYNSNLSGTIPSDIVNRFKFVASLHLLLNNFSSKILISSIKIGLLAKFHWNLACLIISMKKFSVANNLLTGPVPSFQKVYLLRGEVKRKADDPESNRWAKSINGTKGIKASYLIQYYASCLLNLL